MMSGRIEELTDVIRDHAEEFGIVAAYLYGSCAQGNATPLSDLDVAVLLERIPDESEFRTEIGLAAAINVALGIDNADVRVLNDATLLLQGQVVTHGRLIFCTDRQRRVDFECRVRGEYFDYLPSLEMIVKAKIKRIARRGALG